MKKILLLLACVLICSCHKSNDGRKGEASLKSLATIHANNFNAKQLIDDLLIYAKNDTTKVCYALVMPKQTLIRLSISKTYPKDFAYKKMREILTQTMIKGDEYLEELVDKDKSNKDWLLENSVNEPINPIWEQIQEN